MADVKEAIQKQFGNVAFNYSTSVVHASGEDLNHMLRIAGVTGNEVILDAGCGAGHTALAFAPYVAEVVAYDLTSAMLSQVERLAQERGIGNIRVWLGDVEKLPFENRKFDLVVSRYSAHHWSHPEVALSEFLRVLKPTGHFILSDIVAPDYPAIDTFLQCVELLRDLSHVRDYSIKQWQQMLKHSGFTYDVVYQWELPLDFDLWVERMATPSANIGIIRSLFDNAPLEIREALGIQPNYHFKIPGALFLAGKN